MEITLFIDPASGLGIQLDGGTATGELPKLLLRPIMTPLLAKVSAKGQSPLEAKERMNRALNLGFEELKPISPF